MKDKIKIEHGIPAPTGRNYGDVIEAIRSMKIGDSFLFPAIDRNTPYASARRLGIKIKMRRVDDDNVRIWRVS